MGQFRKIGSAIDIDFDTRGEDRRVAVLGLIIVKEGDRSIISWTESDSRMRWLSHRA
jgi:hypothetical protein